MKRSWIFPDHIDFADFIASEAQRNKGAREGKEHSVTG